MENINQTSQQQEFVFENIYYRNDTVFSETQFKDWQLLLQQDMDAENTPFPQTMYSDLNKGRCLKVNNSYYKIKSIVKSNSPKTILNKLIDYDEADKLHSALQYIDEDTAQKLVDLIDKIKLTDNHENKEYYFELNF